MNCAITEITGDVNFFQWALGSDKKVPAASKVEQDRLREAIKNKEEERKRREDEKRKEDEQRKKREEEDQQRRLEEQHDCRAGGTRSTPTLHIVDSLNTLVWAA